MVHFLWIVHGHGTLILITLSRAHTERMHLNCKLVKIFDNISTYGVVRFTCNSMLGFQFSSF